MITVNGNLVESIFEYNSIYENVNFDSLVDRILYSEDADVVEDCINELLDRREILRSCSKRMASYSRFYLEKIVPFVEEAVEELVDVFNYRKTLVEDLGLSDYNSFHYIFNEKFNIGDFMLTDNFLIHYNYFTPGAIENFLVEMNYRGMNNNLFISVTDNINEPEYFFLETDISPLCLNDPRGFVVVGKKEFEELTVDFLEY